MRFVDTHSQSENQTPKKENKKESYKRSKN